MGKELYSTIFVHINCNNHFILAGYNFGRSFLRLRISGPHGFAFMTLHCGIIADKSYLTYLLDHKTVL